jgi:hypothetical protein
LPIRPFRHKRINRAPYLSSAQFPPKRDSLECAIAGGTRRETTPADAGRCFIVHAESCWTERMPFARMLPSVIGSIGSLKRRAAMPWLTTLRFSLTIRQGPSTGARRKPRRCAHACGRLPLKATPALCYAVLSHSGADRRSVVAERIPSGLCWLRGAGVGTASPPTAPRADPSPPVLAGAGVSREPW